MTRIVTMKDVAKLPRHCTRGVVQWLGRIDMTIADLVAGKLDTDRLREVGGFSALKLVEIIERDAEADSTGGSVEDVDHKAEQDLAIGGKNARDRERTLVADQAPEASRDGQE